MNFKCWQPVLPALALPLLTLAGAAQATGTSHPDEVAGESQIVGQTAEQVTAPDHYVPPARTALAPRSAPVNRAYPDPPAGFAQTGDTGAAVSYPATGPAPADTTSTTRAYSAAPDTTPDTTPNTAPQAAPGLLVRRAASAPEAPRAYPRVENASARSEALRPVNDDSGIVTSVPAAPFELPSGTVLKTRLDAVLGTETTPVGSRFTAQLIADAGEHGQILLPAGSAIHGRVTAVHGGRRITGGASMRLQPQSVTLPDGTNYTLQATLTAVDSGDDLKVNDEGVINARGNAKATAAIIGGTAGIAAVTGAVIGGGVGAIVGAGVGAGVGTVVWLKQNHEATLPTGTALFFSLDEPLQLNPR